MATTTAAPMIRLRHPEFAGLSYGADKDSAIQFGNRAGQPQFEAWIPEDHPLLEDLLRDHPEVQIVRDGGPAILWACPFHSDSVFKTKNALLAHMKSKGHGDMIAGVADLPDPAQPVSVDAYRASVQDVPNVTVANNGPIVTPDPE